jgi:FixJ family two-component response regulator
MAAGWGRRISGMEHVFFFFARYMPGLNGLDLQRQLESRGTAEQIVFITGHGDVPTCTQAMKNGAVDFLMKPFNDHELIGAVARALERAKESLRRRAGRHAVRGKIDKLTRENSKFCASSFWAC